MHRIALTALLSVLSVTACAQPASPQAAGAKIAVTAPAAKSEQAYAAGSPEERVLAVLKKLNPKIRVDRIGPAPMAGFREVVASGQVVYISDDGKFLLSLYADGGNSVCTRDPADPSKPIDPAVFKDVHQNGPGYGFKGASKTSVVFRVDPLTGALEKGTWFCSWMSPQQANGLAIDGISGTDGRHMVVGSSANGLPLKQPWYPHIAGAYQGGGYVAVFDAGLKLQQCGYFSNSNLRHVAVRDGWVVAGGTSKPSTKAEEPVRVHKPFQAEAGTEQDGYIVVLRVK